LTGKRVPDIQSVEACFRRVEESGLPGWEAQRRMMPSFRGSVPHEEDLSPAAVLICLIEKDGGLVFPLIRRSVAEGDRHSGQISLPGGRQEGRESLLATAFRESREEIGVPEEALTLIGALSPLPIPVSGHIVHPFAAYCNSKFSYVPDTLEVDEVFDVPLSELLAPETVKIDGNSRRQIPYFHLQGQVVWGATAMILSEFAELIKG